MRKHLFRRKEQGATALLIVLFAILLFVILAIGFLQLMTQEQRRSFDGELSQGAYDAALAGAEDGKRVLESCTRDPSGPGCDTLAQSCKTISNAGFASARPNGEVYIKSVSSAGGSSAGVDYEEAYTCVKIFVNTPDFLGSLQAGQSVVIPLATESDFNQVEIRWFSLKDLSSPPLANPAPGGLLSLPKLADWGNAMPSMLRSQLIQYKDGSLDVATLDNNGGAQTIFLYPKQVGGINDFAHDSRRSGLLEPEPATCKPDFTTYQGYACRALIKLPDLPGGGISGRVAFLRLTPIYGSANFRIAPQKDGVSVNFKGVQPSIDSTGRAGDVFRRIDSRVQLSDPNDGMLYPRAAVDTTDSFCKNFQLGTDAADYSNFCPAP